jgi:hypothetical protein
MHEFEVAVRDELGIDATPPPAPVEPDWRQRARTMITRARRPESVPDDRAGAPVGAVSEER